jgi:hypothetical protein
MSLKTIENSMPELYPICLELFKDKVPLKEKGVLKLNHVGRHGDLTVKFNSNKTEEKDEGWQIKPLEVQIYCAGWLLASIRLNGGEVLKNPYYDEDALIKTLT